MPQKRYWILGCVLLVGVLLMAAPLVICLTFVNNIGLDRGRSITLANDLRNRRLHTGMTREQVDQVIGVDSKKRYSCSRLRGLVDVHAIGSSDRNRAAFLYVRYREEVDGTLVLEEIGGPMDESMLPEHMDCPSDTPVAITPTSVPVKPTATD
jgi:hypothetical protein